MISNYSSEGLKAISDYLNELIEIQKVWFQNELARLASVSSGAISNLRKNSKCIQGQIIYEPKPKTLNRLAPHIPDPLTGKAFTPERFRRVAFGEEPLR